METKNLIGLARECVLCGRCKARCPTYQILWNEAFGPRGRMRLAEAILKEEVSLSQSLQDRLFSCTLCGACEKTCPKVAKVPWVMINIREDLSKSYLKNLISKRGLKWALKHPKATYRLLRFLYPTIKSRLIRHGLISGDSPIFEYNALEWGGVFKPNNTYEVKGRVVLFSGCAVRFVFPYLAEMFITLCTEAGYEVVLPKSEFCCGAPLLSMGMLKEAEVLAKKNLQYIGTLKGDITVSLCPTCVHTMRNIYPLLVDRPIEIEDPVLLLQKIIESSEMKRLKGTVIYHHPCHSLYGLGIKEEVITLLRNTGLTVTELEEGCCGFAGTFSLRFKELSKKLLEQRFHGINKDSATVVTACPGCIFQFMKILPQGRVMHIVEIIDEARDAGQRQKDTSE